MNSAIKCEPALVRRFKGHRGPVNSVHFSPHSGQFASGGDDGYVMIWHYESDKRVFRFIGHEKPVNRVWFCAASDNVVSASADGTVRIWLNTIKGESSVLRCQSPVNCVEVSGRHLVTAANDKTVKLWDFGTKKFIRSFAQHRNWVKWASFDGAGKQIISASDDRTVKIWDTASGKCVKSLNGFSGCPTTVAFQPKRDQCVAASFDDGAVRLWDARTYGLLQLYRASDAGARGISFHPSGNLMLLASEDSTVSILDLLEGRVVYTIEGHEAAVNCVDCTEEHFLSGGGGEAILWKANLEMKPGSACLKEIQNREEAVPRAAVVRTPKIQVPKLPSEKDSSASLQRAPRVLDARQLKEELTKRSRGDEEKIERLTSTVDFLNQKVALLEQKLAIMGDRLDGFVALFGNLSQDHGSAPTSPIQPPGNDLL